MKSSEYTSYEELPLFLNAATVASVLGIAPSSAYELMHEKGFSCFENGKSAAGSQSTVHSMGGGEYDWWQMNKRRKTIYTSWSMPDPAKNYVPLPKGIYRIGLSGEEIAIYGYLFSLENESYRCWPSYETIGKAVHMSKRTVMKYVSLLEEKHLIRTERTEVIRRDGMKYNGTLRYTIAPFREAEDYYHQKQLERLELEAEKQRVQKELAKFTPAGNTA